MEEQILAIGRVLGVDVMTPFVSDEMAPYSTQAVPVRRIVTADGRIMDLDVKAGQLIGYCDDEPDQIPEGAQPRHAAFPQKVHQEAWNFLETMGLTEELTRIKRRLDSPTGKWPPEYFHSIYWRMDGLAEYDGIHRTTGFAHLDMTVYSGKITGYAYRTAEVNPAELVEHIDARQAVERAVNFLKGSTPALGIDPIKLITIPDSLWTRPKGEPPSPAGPPRVYWLVTLNPEGGDMLATVLVDIVTGEAHVQ
jgi:hypothetical protein